ncbi:MAG: NADH-quinone oxidoreductase subunit NuoN [Rhodospirillaceae bacterium]|nr:NADH-quinone oxidoreductase subunit NuoN [Rhodospirillaceae bacterium]
MIGGLSKLILVLPELVLLGAALSLLMFGVFRREQSDSGITSLAVVFMGLALVFVFAIPNSEITIFDGLLINDPFAKFMKSLVLIGAMLTLIMGYGYRKRGELVNFEYPVLILFATLGMLLMISANNLMALYIGIELQSLSLYVIAAFDRDSRRSGEAGLKYFILGALSSGLLLYGCSLVYGFSGSTSFEGIASALNTIGADSIGLTIGMVFLCAGLAFKVSAVPFHMWTPDVYEGSPTPSTAFFAAAPKIAGVAIFIRVLVDPFADLVAQWQQVVIAISVASMSLGTLAAIYQTNIKRLMAYSSIANIGYALVGLAAGTSDGVQSVIIYMSIYLIMIVGTFGCILSMRVHGQMMEDINDLAGLGRTNPLLAIALTALMFSFVGIPPLAGFFGKLYVFLAAINAGLYWLAVIGLLTSVVGAFYYLRIVKLMYFDEARESFDSPIDKELVAVIAFCSILVGLFFAYPTPMIKGAAVAAETLFQ